jgi:NAD(P)-dependent dehydrogenase (short-subunit alcohol dehydrogenase family)
LIAKHIVPIFKQNNNGKGAGGIINIASIAGLIALPASLPYGPIKAAVLQMTRNLALDLGPFNIRVNSISPGAIDSPILQSLSESLGVNKAEFDELNSGKCLKRLGKAEEIANMTVFIASNLCQFMTGTNLVIDGGYTTV